MSFLTKWNLRQFSLSVLWLLCSFTFLALCLMYVHYMKFVEFPDWFYEAAHFKKEGFYKMARWHYLKGQVFVLWWYVAFAFCLDAIMSLAGLRTK